MSRLTGGQPYPSSRAMLTAGCTHWIEEYGQNDRAAGQTLAHIQATRLAFWKDGANRRPPVNG